MKKLTEEQFQRAVDYIMTHARPVDRHLFNYHFLGGSKMSVIASLCKYQNKDGGMGHAMEPDIRSAESSPIATATAMEYAREVNAPWQHPFIRSAMNYFTKTYETYNQWPLKLPHMNDSPHADWWHFSNIEEGFNPNPGAQIIGYYHAYPLSIPEHLLPTFHDHVFQHIENRPEGLEHHEMLCYLRLVEEMPDPGKSMIIDYLRDTSRKVATLDPNLWRKYTAKPLWLAPTPNSPLSNVLEDAIQLNLDFEIDQQQPDGSWLPPWKWGQYTEVWENEVVHEWKGMLTVQILKALKSYERIEIL